MGIIELYISLTITYFQAVAWPFIDFLKKKLLILQLKYKRIL